MNKIKKEIKEFKKLSIECKKCHSELIMDIDLNNTLRVPYKCSVCDSDFGIDPRDDIYARLQRLIQTSNDADLQARFSIICEE